MLFRLHQRTGFPVVTFRPPFVYGPGNPYYREAFFWDRLRLERPIIIPGDGHRLMQFVYVHDLVQAMLRAMDEPAAVGEAFNIGNSRPLSQAEVVTLLAQVAGVEPTLVRVPRDLIQQAGGDPMGNPSYFGEYFDVPPITENVTKVTRVLKVKPTPLEAGLKETYRAYLKAKKTAPDCTFEDRLLELARNGARLGAN
jgi:nucleoside-diphosphate-sugar epimerase